MTQRKDRRHSQIPTKYADRKTDPVRRVERVLLAVIVVLVLLAVALWLGWVG